MKELLARYAERIDNATLRERALLFLAAAVVLIFAFNAAFVQPLRDTQRRVAADIAQTERELRAVQTGLQQLMRGRDADPDAKNRERIARLTAELQKLDAGIAEKQRRFTPPDRMRVVLEEMLQRDKRLQLVDLKTLPVTALSDTVAQGGGRIYRHGVEMTLSGTYLDLYAYLRALEGLPTQLYWGRAELAVAGYPVATLKLTVYTLSVEQAWLVV